MPSTGLWLGTGKCPSLVLIAGVRKRQAAWWQPAVSGM